MTPDFTQLDIDVRPAVCVTIPEAGIIMAVVVVKGEELAQLPQIAGAQTAFPGRWYCASVSIIGNKMKFSLASGEYLTVTEAETRAQEIARELGQRVKAKVFETQLRNTSLGPQQ